MEEPLYETPKKSPRRATTFAEESNESLESTVDVAKAHNASALEANRRGNSASVRTVKDSMSNFQEWLNEGDYSGLKSEINATGAGGKNNIYWLPTAASRIVLGHCWELQDPSFQEPLGALRTPTGKTLFSANDSQYGVEDNLFEDRLYEKERMLFVNPGGDQVDAVRVATENDVGMLDEDDENLRALMHDMDILPQRQLFSSGFQRSGVDRRSKRLTSSYEEEIEKRNEELKENLFTIRRKTKNIEKVFDELDKMDIKLAMLAESAIGKVRFLEMAILPVYRDSSRHELVRKNADAGMKSISNALGHFTAVEEHAAAIQAGPVKNLVEYCQKMDRLKAAIIFLTETSSPELIMLENLFKAGRDNLIKEYGDLLRLHSKPIPAVMIQDAINNSLHDPSASHEFSHFAESVHEDLVTLTKWFLANQTKKFGFYDFMEVYATFRGATVRESLDQFRIHFRDVGGITNPEYDVGSVSRLSIEQDSQSGGASQGDRMSLSVIAEDNRDVVKSSWKAKNKVQKTSTRKKSPEEAGAGLFKMLRRRTTRARAKRISGGPIGVDEDTYLRVESYMALASAFLKIIESEVGLMYGIIPSEHMRDVFDRVVRPIVNMFVVNGKELAEKIMEHVSNGDYSAVLLLLQILEHFEDLKALFDSALEAARLDTVRHWHSIVLIFRAAVLKTMDNYLSSIKENSDRSYPPDGTIHELTSNTIAFFSNLVDFRPLFDALISEEDKKQTGVNRPNFQSHNFAQYLNSVISHLLANLTTRAELYFDQTLKFIFMLNNISYLWNYLKSSGVVDLMKEEQPNVDKLIEQKIVEYKKSYYECWNNLTKLLSDAIGETNTVRYQPGSHLKDKERQYLKDKCAAVAKEMQTIFSKHEKYSVPDTELRTELKGKVSSLLCPLYSTYRDRYIVLAFTKFHDKYLPYDSDGFKATVSRLFDSDARMRGSESSLQKIQLGKR